MKGYNCLLLKNKIKTGKFIDDDYKIIKLDPNEKTVLKI